MSMRRPVWEKQTVNTGKPEVVTNPVYIPVCLLAASQALHLPPALPILPWLRHLSPSWLLHLGLEDLLQVVLLCFLALLILLIMKNSQEFIILL